MEALGPRVKLRSSATATNDRRCLSSTSTQRFIAARDECAKESLFHFPATMAHHRRMNTITAPRGPELFAGSRFTWHLTAEQNGGQASLADVLVRPGSEPPLHVHAREDETYLVLEGELTFQRGLERIAVDPGTSVHLPRGLQHGFAVHSEIARLIVLITPGGLEQGFAKLAVPTDLELPPVPTGPPSHEEAEALSDAFADRGVTFVGPPLPVLLEPEAS
jgi:quercetin dioxygenase-like cupin family protein